MINHLVPSEFYLGQNYPNPFKEKTVIKYCVAYKSNVQITVYDAEGKEVEKLVDEEQQPGTYQVEFSTTQCHSCASGNLKDGYYYYKMIAGEYSSEKKWFCINNLLRSNTMKTFLQLFLCLLILLPTILFGQKQYPRPLENVDITKIWQSTPGIIPENNMQYDPVVADIINQTNLDSLISYVRILSGEDSVWIGSNKVLIRNRGGSGGDLTAEYIKEKLSSYNLEVYEQNYSTTGKNVYAVQEGYLYPEKQYILCAHYDAVDVYCADDNASGVAAVIEAARILSKYDFKYTLIYALWDEEEIGLVGSNYYASQASSNQDEIQGVLNMDMLAWDGNDDGLLDIHSQNSGNSNEIANLMVIINWFYELSLNPVIYNPGTWQSDHSSFWNYGFGAVLLIEAYYGNDLNPYYHGIEDRIDKFNLPYFHNLSKLSIGTISTLLEATTDTLLASVTPNIGYQTYPSNIQIKGVNTHFTEGSGTQQVWLSKDQETIISDSFVVNSNTILNGYFHIPASASAGKWNLNVQTNVDGIIIKEDCFNILLPPAIIVINPDSIVVGVLPGSTTTKTLTISNQGETDLYFNIVGGFSSTNIALQFDGIDDYVEVLDNVSLQLPTYFTVEAWGYIKSLPPPGYDHIPIVWRGNNIGWGNDYHFRIASREGGLVTWGSGGQDGGEYFFDGGTIVTNEWYHFAYVVNRSNMSAYINGELVNSWSGNPPYMVSGYKTYLGWANPAGVNVYTDGVVDEVRIWSVARTQKEIQQFMHQQLTGTEPGLSAYWQFNEGTGDITFDKTINSNQGSLFGGVSWINSTAPLQPGWLFINSDSGNCSAHSSMDIEMLFDATELDSGDYYASIIIKSSDPFTPSVVVPIHLIVSTSVNIEEEQNIPIVFKLTQNYPNPFNPSTTIKYSIPELSRVTLKVFNVLGEEVTTLVNEEEIAGNYSIEFNASSLPSGVYFYRLQAGDFTSVRKMILLK